MSVPSSPVRNTQRNYFIPPTIRKQPKRSNNLSINNVINKIRLNENNNLTSLLNEFKRKLNNNQINEIPYRSKASIDNKIYISNENDTNRNGKKVYKIAKKKKITNEYLSYSLLKKKYPEDENIHYSKMYGCESIPNSNFVLLVLQYKENIKPIHCKGNLIKFYKNMHVKKAINYLKKAGIRHEDDHENIFRYKINNNINNNNNNNCNNNTSYIFYIIDFEDVTFLKKNNNELNQITINNLNKNVRNKAMNLNTSIRYFQDNNQSPLKKVRQMSIFN